MNIAGVTSGERSFHRRLFLERTLTFRRFGENWCQHIQSVLDLIRELGNS